MSENPGEAHGIRRFGGLDPAALFEIALASPPENPARRHLKRALPLVLAVTACSSSIWFFAKHNPAPAPTKTGPPATQKKSPPAPAKRPVAEIQAAAAAGDIVSKIELGLLHLEGVGVPLDKGAAARLFTEAAKAGSARADSLLQLRMQIQCLDHKRVHDYWLPLAEAGDAKIMSALGELHMRGRGVQQDPHKAVYWFERAIAAGYLPAHLHLVKMYTGNRGLPPDLVKKIHHLRKGAEAGRWDAIIDLARHLIAGEGLERNPEEAYALLIRAAEEGSEESVELVGQLYAEGLGVPKSLPDAIYWMQIGSDEGSHRAEIMLESLRKNGQLPDPDQYPKNFAELLELARKDRPAACYEAGVFYLRGQGVRKNEPEGARWILRAAELGHPRAQWHIADILEAGRYVPRDAEAAARWRETHRATVANLPHIPANDSESYFLVNGNTDP
jgi:TPR repeat protein